MPFSMFLSREEVTSFYRLNEMPIAWDNVTLKKLWVLPYFHKPKCALFFYCWSYVKTQKI